ncbi:HlyD family secretion protein [Aminobacter lissarensis]|uniref:HlyD family secretion protein n=1 Tax=Aminobacter carboxidus TaxID=376165 RepID=A0A8E1WEQ5_9HYPH|nr:efflux RND transporter periplasmic adaptor subunit [Aminobacter lissarensis]MBB6467445.1 HlyD family secretion protein [Aminobacter lissarensis]
MTHSLHRRAGIAAIAVALLASAVMPVAADSAANAAVPAETAKRLVSTFVVASDMTEWTLSFTGVLAAREEVAVGAPFQEQRIASVDVEVGDRVEAGQILVRLDTAMRDNQLRESEGRLARANAALAQQQAKAAQALAALQRATPLKQSGALSTQAFADRASTEAVERQGVALAQAEVDQAVAQLTESRRLVERNVIVAPVAGVVSERNANAGALTGADPLIRLIRDGEVELAAEIPERELPRLAVGQAASVSLPGMDGKIPGKVRLISPKIDRETRLGVARIAFETDTALFPGAFARAAVVVAKREAIVIADSALVYGGKDKTAVFVVENGKVDLRPVQTGMRDNGRLEIRAGLKEGDVVVAKAGASLRDGDVVATTDIGAKTGSVKP